MTNTTSKIGLELMPHQQRWVEDKARFRVWDCDRRLGATTAVIEDVARCGGKARIVVAGDRELFEFLRALGDFRLDDRDVEVVVGEPRGARARAVDLLVYDNALSFDYKGLSWPRPLFMAVPAARRVAVVTTGLHARDGGREFLDRLACDSDFSLHTTTAAEAIADGLGRRVCEARGETWSAEWEQRWIDGLRRSDPMGVAWRL